MANYMARVELHSATWNDYEALHAGMQRRGFLRFIRGSDGKTYQLPTGTYVASQTNVSLQVALSAAVEAASETRRPSSVVVADWTAASWQGLQMVG